MSVVREFTLPAQPAAGEIQFVPLGGDGWIAPQSCYVGDVQATGTASGGHIHLQVLRDPRFEHIVQFLSLESSSITAIQFRFDFFRTLDVAIHNVGTSQIAVPSGRVLACQIWSPPPLVDPVKWAGSTDNVDTELVKFKFVAYNFNIRASEKVPLGVMYQSLPRSATSV